jgi:hypothetical protein
MANVNRASGARPVKHISGSPYNGQCNKYVCTTGNAVFLGDFVKSGGTADADGVASVVIAAAGDTLRGVVVGVVPETADSLIYRASSTTRYLMVCDDPDIIFEIQADNGGANLALIDVGENADILVTGGSTVTGTSATELDSSTHVTTTAQLRILGFSQRADNVPASDYAKVLVLINEHELKSTAGV